MSLSMRIFRIFGFKMMESSEELKLSELVIRWISTVCLLVTIFQAAAFSLVHLDEGEILLFLTFNLACVGFASLSTLKVYMIGVKYCKILSEIVEKLDELFPKTNHEQSRNNTKKYLNILQVQNWIYIILTPLFFCMFNFSEIAISLFNFLLVDGSYDRNFSYSLWFPFGFDGKVPIVFELFYTVGTIGSFFAIFINMAADLLYCSLLTVLCMEFEILSKNFQDLDKGISRKELAKLVNKHYQLIRLNYIFH